MTGVEIRNKAHSPLASRPPVDIGFSKYSRTGLSALSDMYTIPMMNIGMAAMMAITRWNKSFLFFSFLYICRVTSSDEGGCHIERWRWGVDVAVEIVDIIVRIVK
jgi:hypothetical protein